MKRLCLVALLLLPLGSACEFKGVIQTPVVEDVALPDQFRILSLQLRGSTQADARVAAGEQVDQDGLDDCNWWLSFRLDGPARDTGEEQTVTLHPTSTRLHDGEVFYKQVKFVLYP